MYALGEVLDDGDFRDMTMTAIMPAKNTTPQKLPMCFTFHLTGEIRNKHCLGQS